MNTKTIPSDPLLDKLHLRPETRRFYTDLSPCKRAWALATAAYETASELSHTEQQATLAAMNAALAATDPEPDVVTMAGFTREQRLAAYALWKAWNARHPELGLACRAIIAKHKVLRFQALLREAEQCLVAWAKDQWQQREPQRFANVAPMFERFAAGDLPHSIREKFIANCFNCPPVI